MRNAAILYSLLLVACGGFATRPPVETTELTPQVTDDDETATEGDEQGSVEIASVGDHEPAEQTSDSSTRFVPHSPNRFNPGVPNQNTGGVSTYGDIALTDGQQSFVGRSGGSVRVPTEWTATGVCEGMASETPAHLLVLDSPAAWLQVDLESQADLSLILDGPTGRHCSDNYAGTDPALAGEHWPAGAYELRIGTSGQDPGVQHDYSLSVEVELESEDQSASFRPRRFNETNPGFPNFAMGGRSRYGDIDVVDEAVTLGGISGGERSVDDFGATPTGPCRGMTDIIPSHALTLSQEVEFMRITVLGSGDTTMLLEGPTGRLCADDVNGVDPELSGNFWPAGEYEIFVGSASAEGPSYALTVDPFRGASRSGDVEPEPDEVVEEVAAPALERPDPADVARLTFETLSELQGATESWVWRESNNGSQYLAIPSIVCTTSGRDEEASCRRASVAERIPTEFLTAGSTEVDGDSAHLLVDWATRVRSDSGITELRGGRTEVTIPEIICRYSGEEGGEADSSSYRCGIVSPSN